MASAAAAEASASPSATTPSSDEQVPDGFLHLLTLVSNLALFDLIVGGGFETSLAPVGSSMSSSESAEKGSAMGRTLLEQTDRQSRACKIFAGCPVAPAEINS